MPIELKTTLTSINLANHRCDCLILGVFQEYRLPESTSKLNDKRKKNISRFLRSNPSFTAKLGESLLWQRPAGVLAQRILLIGLGEKRHYDSAAYIKAQQKTAEIIHQEKWEQVLHAIAQETPKLSETNWGIRQTTRILHANSYHFKNLLKKDTSKKTVSVCLSVERERLTDVASIHLGAGAAVGAGHLLDAPTGRHTGKFVYSN